MAATAAAGAPIFPLGNGRTSYEDHHLWPAITCRVFAFDIPVDQRKRECTRSRLSRAPRRDILQQQPLISRRWLFADRRLRRRRILSVKLFSKLEGYHGVGKH